MTETTALADLAVDAAEGAGRLLLEYRRRHLSVTTKSTDTDPVSEADRESERLIVDRLLDARPDDGILAEEDSTERRGSSGIGWVIDPLDGTVNYLYGFPQWCVSIAAEDDDGPLVGVVHDPERSETFVATRRHGTRLGDHQLEVNRPTELGQTLVATGFAYDPRVRAEQGRMAADLLTRARDIRRAGAAALDLAWVAAGRIDAYYEFALNRWDWAAGRLLVTQAGGVVTDHRRRLGGSDRTGLVAGGQAAHDAVVRWLQGEHR